MEQSFARRNIAVGKSIKYKNYDVRIKNFVSKYDRNDVLRYLKNISHNVVV